MKVNDYISKSNIKKSVSLQRLQELKQYYVAMHRYYMLKLYDEGYVDDPTVFSKTQIIKNFVDMGVTGIADSAGKVVLSYEWVDYLCRRKSNKEFSDFLCLLRNAVKYRDYSNDLDMLYEEFYSSKSIKLTFRLSGSKADLLRLKATKGSLQALVSSGKTLYTVSIKDYLWNLGMEQLGIPKEEWLKDGILCRDLKHEDEVRFIQLIFDGRMVSDGKYGDLLNGYLLNNKWSKDSDNIISQKGLLEYLHYSRYSDINNKWQEELDKLESEGKNVVCLLNNEIYVEKDIVNYKIPVSMFAVMCDNCEDTMVVATNCMSGYIGEAYTAEYLMEEGVSYVGLPIKLVDEDLDELSLYDREQTDIKVETWFKHNDVDFTFEELRVRNPFKKSTQELNYALYEIYKKAHSGELGSISLEKYSIKEINTAKRKVAQMIVKQEGA